MGKLALHWKIILGMVLGVIVGYLAVQIGGGSKFIVNWVEHLHKYPEAYSRTTHRSLTSQRDYRSTRYL